MRTEGKIENEENKRKIRIKERKEWEGKERSKKKIWQLNEKKEKKKKEK